MSLKPVKPITPVIDGNVVGYDEFNQLAAYEAYNEGPLPSQRGVKMWHIWDVRPKTCPICKKGWENTFKSMVDQTSLWRKYEDDKLVDNTFAHSTCHVGFLHVTERYMWENIFGSLNKPFEINEMPNQYGGGYDTPWYHIKAIGLTFTVGARRRVYSITVSSVDDLLPMFAQENVTKEFKPYEGQFLIHAHGKDDAKRYIQLIRDAVTPVAELMKEA